MKQRIIDELKRIEQSYGVKIVYAVESGSRAWGFPSQDSDYDVRFIYVPKKEWYFSIEQERDVIEEPIHDLLDISGWELRKTLRLFKKSNPPLLEWLSSDIVYYEAFTTAKQLRKLRTEHLSLKQACITISIWREGTSRITFKGKRSKSKSISMCFGLFWLANGLKSTEPFRQWILLF